LTLQRNGEIDDFKKNLSLLSVIDQAMGQFKKIDLFHSFASIEQDLSEIFQKEVMLTEIQKDEEPREENLLKVLLKGHGVLKSLSSRVGPTVFYFAPPEVLMVNNFHQKMPMEGSFSIPSARVPGSTLNLWFSSPRPTVC